MIRALLPVSAMPLPHRPPRHNVGHSVFGRYGVFVTVVVASTLFGAAVVGRAGAHPVAPSKPAIVAQFNVGNLLGAGKDVAVRAALSAFGKSLGDQLPIVVPAGDAYPTTSTPPGPPFGPAATPDIAPLLRESRDGTITLAPGDYTFPVGVFCMRAHSGSPSAHRYLVAPLRGSAADIITALNSRIPSSRVEHHVLQVLSWDIQAGMAYAAMPSDQRAAVDRIIPDYRGRLNGDFYERIRGQYAQTAQNIPGMPSFEDALTRVGPVGAQVVALQNLRQELAQPPPTFEELAHALVPDLPADGVTDVRGATPWSRVSERVFVRFVTDGNYATPGTYQVRVLPATVSARSGPSRAADVLVFAPAPGRRGEARARTAARLAPTRAMAIVAQTSSGGSVPFTNIVNNPGTDAVQPLTQTPLAPLPHELPGAPSRPGGPKPPRRHPKKPPEATIISETIATLPGNRDRTLVGVGEEVLLTFTGGDALWSLSGADGSIESEGGSAAMYSAASVGAVETITARGAHATGTITFRVIPPSGVVTRRAPGTPSLHRIGRPDSGLQLLTYLTPDSVSFQFINFIEREVGAVGTGVFKHNDGQGHGPNPVALPVGAVVPGLGSQLQAVDTAYSGNPCVAAPFEPSFLVFDIPVDYQLWRGGGFHRFATVVQSSSVRADGVSLETEKAQGFVTLAVGDPSTIYNENCAPAPGH